MTEARPEGLGRIVCTPTITGVCTHCGGGYVKVQLDSGECVRLDDEPVECWFADGWQRVIGQDARPAKVHVVHRCRMRL